jgi:hypothetical protein
MQFNPDFGLYNSPLETLLHAFGAHTLLTKNNQKNKNGFISHLVY